MTNPPAPVSSARQTLVIQRRGRGRAQPAEDEVAVEEPLEIRVEGRAVTVTMRTPGHDDELAAGFLLTEGVIRRREDLLEVNRCPTTAGTTGNVVDVLLRRPEAVDFTRLTRHVFSSSSCGLCGRATLEAVHREHPPLPAAAAGWTAEVLLELPARLGAAQATFQRTGGLHAAALFDPDGALTVVREDVGRHNAVDKVLGHALLRAAAQEPPVQALLVSGRVSFEIVQKALAARVPLIAAISAPTSLAVDLARTSGQTLVGFLRDGRFNVYAGSVRP